MKSLSVDNIVISSPHIGMATKRDIYKEVIAASRCVDVDLSLIDKLRISVVKENYFKCDDWSAFCDKPNGLEEKYRISINLNSFYNKKSRAELFLHEFTHIKQYQSGQIIVTEDGKEFWEGKEIPNGMSLLKLSLSEYKNLPWEKEPYLNEKKYLKEFFKIKGSL